MKAIMKESEMIYLASKAVDKNWSIDDLSWCYELQGRREFVDRVWEYVIEIMEIGKLAFKEKYIEYKLYF